jgi:choline dehydrogenase-like flavoprotein
MIKKFTIIGSGVAGANAALTLLEKGHKVEMLDYGKSDSAPLEASQTFKTVKNNSQLAARFFYGNDLSGINGPNDSDIFKYPKRRPSISTVNLYNNEENTDQFQPIFSNCKGGLAVAWGANSIEFNQDDMIGFEYSKKDIESSYEDAFKRLHVSGPVHEDDLSNIVNASYKFNSSHDMSSADQNFIRNVKFKNKYFFKNKNVLIGQSRLAIDNRINSEKKCYSCGLCIWGCPSNSIYSPLKTLQDCKKFKNFKYINNVKVSHFKSDGEVIKYVIDTSGSKYKVSNVILAAGAINSAIILLKSFKENKIVDKNIIRSVGLLDTEVIKVPYLSLSKIFKKFTTDRIQFNGLLAMVKNEKKNFPLWTQVELLSLGSLIYHPLLKKIPLGVRNSIFIFNHIKNMLGVATIFLPDQHNDRNYIEVDFSGPIDKVRYLYTSTGEKEALKKDVIRKLKNYMRSIGSIMISRQAIRAKNGSGIHYAGTIPIRAEKTRGCVNSHCKSYDFNNLHIVDGSIFPSLPSKSITLNIAANSIRVCREL